jgi:hypothetical protein
MPVRPVHHRRYRKYRWSSLQGCLFGFLRNNTCPAGQYVCPQRNLMREFRPPCARYLRQIPVSLSRSSILFTHWLSWSSAILAWPQWTNLLQERYTDQHCVTIYFNIKILCKIKISFLSCEIKYTTLCAAPGRSPGDVRYCIVSRFSIASVQYPCPT